MTKKKVLSVCFSKNESEIDGMEFEANDLERFIYLIQEVKGSTSMRHFDGLHLNFYGDEELDIWLKVN